MSKKLIQKLPKSDKNLKKVVTLYRNVSKVFMLEDRTYVAPFSGDEDEVEEELPEEDEEKDEEEEESDDDDWGTPVE